MNHTQNSPNEAHHHEEFNVKTFLFTMVVTLAGLLLALRLIAPSVWNMQITSTLTSGLVVFLAISMLNAFVEYFFHRYVLHMPAIPFLKHFYKQHTLHHALTTIGKKRGKDGRGIAVVENKFPITEPEQTEASFFPWYSYAIFAAIVTPILAVCQYYFPSFPWFIGGFLALASSLSLYEILHAINHWPFEKWEPLINHPRWSWFWKPVYGFHLRHHAAIECNESISGFFGLPITDWVFGTCVIPETVYYDGEEWSQEKFTNPRPRLFIRLLDRVAKKAVADRRARAAQGPNSISQPTPISNKAKLLNVLTQGTGIVVSLTALTLLTVFACLRGNAWHIVTFIVFGLSLLTLYTVTLVYKSRLTETAKRSWQRLVHAAIFISIAGTSTPLLLASQRDSAGWTAFGIIWGLCLAGALFQILSTNHRPFITTAAYLLIGWAFITTLNPAIVHIPSGALNLIIAGAICYSLVAAFLLWKGSRANYAIRHFLAIGGSSCHVLAALIFLLPSASV